MIGKKSMDSDGSGDHDMVDLADEPAFLEG